MSARVFESSWKSYSQTRNVFRNYEYAVFGSGLAQMYHKIAEEGFATIYIHIWKTRQGALVDARVRLRDLADESSRLY